MRCRANFWFPVPDTTPSVIDTYPSIKAAREEFNLFVDEFKRYGGEPPVGWIYPMDSDEPMILLGVSGKGRVIEVRET